MPTQLTELSDRDVLRLLGERVRRARLERNLTQRETADRAGLVRQTISAVERGNDATMASFVAILRALGQVDALDAVLPETTTSPIDALDRSAPRQRASSTRAAPDAWTWGDEA